MKSNSAPNKRKVSAVRKQSETYHNLIRVRLQLQKYSNYVARWPHPWLLRGVADAEITPEEHADEYISQLQRSIGRLLLCLYGKLKPLKELHISNSDPFDVIDVLPKRRAEILEHLDHWNQKTSVKVDKSFEVLHKSISSQVNYFLDNVGDFLKQARPTNLPDNVIGYDLLKEKLGTQQCRSIIQTEIYNDQLFYVQLLRFLNQTGDESDINLREEEKQLRNDHFDKPRMSEAKTSKSRRLCYTVIDKLQNFVERTRNKASTSPDVVDLIIRSFFKT
ncbi:AATF isoform X2 [Babesia ovis]|uniref:AATF isoform X2 n=1 Tax=Babesia ovis TaxID=5869 RepID=A0A9W5TCL8_BABOV|nr:AATF isoform X2 [Babesia ovis]